MRTPRPRAPAAPWLRGARRASAESRTRRLPTCREYSESGAGRWFGGSDRAACDPATCERETHEAEQHGEPQRGEPGEQGRIERGRLIEPALDEQDSHPALGHT